MAKRKTNEQFTKEVYELVGDEYIFLEEYINSKTKIKCRHNECGYEWRIRPGNFLSGNRCPQCNRPNLNRDTKQFKQEVYELVGDEYKVLGEYVNVNTPISIKHNKCGYEWKVRPNDFLNNSSRCPECRKIERANKQRKTHEEFINELEDIHPNKYEVLGKYKRYHDKIKIKCKDCGYISERRASNLLKNGCPNCSGNRPITQEEFESDINKLWGGIYKVIGTYINSDTLIEILCNKCNKTWFTRPYNLKLGYSCPSCAGNKKKTTDDFKEDVYNVVGDEYTVLGDYIHNKANILIKHNICGYEWETKPASFLSNGNRCPQCVSSKGEEIIAKYLNNNNIRYIREYTFDDCRNKLPLPFDFYLPDYNLLIEYDGEQHYMPKTFGGISEERAKLNFKEQQKRDNIKNTYCLKNNIKLLRIPYWDFDNIEQIVCEELNMLIPSQAS